MNYEENPFESVQVAGEWISSVENEKDLIRDRELYPLLENWVEQVNPEVVVEIGAGQGICSSKLGDFKGKYIGIEPSQPLVDRAQELYKSDDREFIVGNAYHLPLAENAVSAGFSVNVWFHLENLAKASTELARVLKAGSKFLIITANPNNSNIWKSFYFDEVHEGKKTTGKANVPINPLSKNIFYDHSLKEITEGLESAGLSVDNSKTFGDDNHGNEGIFIAIEGHK